jgi:hypothetical protein
MMVSLAIATLLLVTLMGVVSRLFAHRRILEEKYSMPAWTVRFRAQVEYDFANCRAVLVNQNRLILNGYSASGGDNEEGRVHLPVQVVYAPALIGDEVFLVRSERGALEGTSSPERESIMCAGLFRVVSQTPLDTDVPPPVLSLVWSGVFDGKEVRLPMVLVRHGVPK